MRTIKMSPDKEDGKKTVRKLLLDTESFTNWSAIPESFNVSIISTQLD